jgi:hypothetical protein
MMRLRLGLLVHHLASRFQISDSLVSSIFFNMDKTYEVRAKPSYCMTCKTCNKRKPPTVLQNVFPHGRCIIDCTKVFIETPSSLDTQAQCW